MWHRALNDNATSQLHRNLLAPYIHSPFQINVATLWRLISLDHYLKTTGTTASLRSWTAWAAIFNSWRHEQTSVTQRNWHTCSLTGYCENGLPADIISDRDKLFISKFWKALHKLTGVKLKLSTAYHPQTDGTSERTNKTINQCLRYHIERNQKGWSHVLPHIHFHMMNTINTSTGFTPFQLRMGQSQQLIPPILPLPKDASQEDISVRDIIRQLHDDVSEAQDNLLRAKISQSVEANKHRSLTFPFAIGSRVRLTTLHCRNEYKAKGEKRVAKFMPRYDGPYTIVGTDEQHSTVTIKLPNAPNIFPTFHTSEVLPFIETNTSLFPSHKFEEPLPILTPKGNEEFFIEKIIDERCRGHGRQFLVHWRSYGQEHDHWLAGSELQDCAALDDWLTSRGES